MVLSTTSQPHLTQRPKATKLLEEKVEQLSGANETLLCNLATLYELESSKAAAKKKVGVVGG